MADKSELQLANERIKALEAELKAAAERTATAESQFKNVAASNAELIKANDNLALRLQAELKAAAERTAPTSAQKPSFADLADQHNALLAQGQLEAAAAFHEQHIATFKD